MEQRIQNIEKRLDDLINNHVFHLEKDTSEMKADMGWVKKLVGIVATATITTLIGTIFTILYK